MNIVLPNHIQQALVNTAGRGRPVPPHLARAVANQIQMQARRQGKKKPVDNSNRRVGYRTSAGGSWLNGLFARMVQTRQPIISIPVTRDADPSVDVVALGNSPTYHGYNDIRELKAAFRVGALGGSNKEYKNTTMAADVFTSSHHATTPATGEPAAGWKLRITASALNYARAPVVITVGQILDTAGTLSIPTPTFQALVHGWRGVELIVPAIRNSGGVATIARGSMNDVLVTTQTQSTLGLQVSAIDANHRCVIESLNERDLAARVRGAVYDELDADDEFEAVADEDETDVGVGIR